jgi:hypothetical protein
MVALRTKTLCAMRQVVRSRKVAHHKRCRSSVSSDVDVYNSCKLLDSIYQNSIVAH